MLSWTIQSYLAKNGIPFEAIPHPRSVTAEETAHAAHIEERRLAKIVVVRIEGQMTMLVLHADERIDLERLREQMRVDDLEICSEREFEDRFPDCEVGAMPPFGDLFGMPVIVSESIASDEKITFNAGSHTELITMNYRDFARITKPMVGAFASH